MGQYLGDEIKCCHIFIKEKKIHCRVYHVNSVNIKSVYLVLNIYVIIQYQIVISQIAQLMLWKNNMPGTFIPYNEVEDQGIATVKSGGNLYIKKGRQHIGKKVLWFVMKEE